jgi:mono/diheme cytochrome c family protein
MLARLGFLVARPRMGALAVAGILALVAGSVAFLNAGTATAQQGSARGATVYQMNCQVCHGVNAQGRLGPPLNQLPPEIAQAPRPAVVQGLTGLLRGGIPGAMPRFVPEQVSDADVAALVEYLFEVSANRPAGRGYYEALAPVAAVPSTPDRAYFPQTQHTVAGAFKTFWERNGGLAIFGYPISEEYTLTTEEGEVITAQAFERARFEYRVGADGRPGVALGLLGVEDRALRMHFLERGGEDGPPEGP